MIQNMLQLSDFARVGWVPEVLDEQIFLVRDVLTSNECAETLKELQSYSEEDWSRSYIDGMREYSLRQFGRSMEDLIEEGVFTLDPAWADKNITLQNSQLLHTFNQRVHKLVESYPELEFRGLGNAQRQYTGSELKLHTDGDSEPAVVYAVIFYLNDDYTEGQLYFPTRSLEVKPPAGSLVIFPTTSEYKHGVHAVGVGPVRYVLPSFIQTNQENHAD
jgi:hypothetical protein